MFYLIQFKPYWQPKIVYVPDGMTVQDIYPGWRVWSNRSTEVPNTYNCYDLAYKYSARVNLRNDYLYWK